MIYKICLYFILFLIYSILGWLIETVFCSYHEKKLVLNRGFLIGPYCPIYGSAALAMILFLSEYKNDYLTFFIMAVVYSSVIEFGTSYILEKIFKARWWDYSEHKFNLDGRICLSNCLLFGVLGILLIFFVNPFFESILKLIPTTITIILAIILFIIFLLDIIITFTIVSKLKLNIQNIRSDSTEEMDNAIKIALSKNRKLYKRLFNAFPKVEFKFDNKHKIIKNLRNRINEVDKLLLERKMEVMKLKENIKKMKADNANDNDIDSAKKELKTLRRKKIK